MEKSDKIAFLLESCIFVSSVIYYLKNKRLLAKQRHLLNFIKGAYTFSPSILMEVLSKEEINSYSNFLKYQRKNGVVTFYLFLQGKITSKQFIRSLFNDTKKLVISHKVIEPIYSNSDFQNPKDFVIQTDMIKNFFLKDSESLSKLKVRLDPKKTIFQDSMKLLGEKVVFRDSNIFLFTLSYVILYLKILLNFIRLQPQIKGWKVGEKITEFGVKTGQHAVLFGKLLID